MDIEKDYGKVYSKESREILNLVLEDNGSPSVLFAYCTYACDVERMKQLTDVKKVRQLQSKKVRDCIPVEAIDKASLAIVGWKNKEEAKEMSMDLKSLVNDDEEREEEEEKKRKKEEERKEEEGKKKEEEEEDEWSDDLLPVDIDYLVNSLNQGAGASVMHLPSSYTAQPIPVSALPPSQPRQLPQPPLPPSPTPVPLQPVQPRQPPQPAFEPAPVPVQPRQPPQPAPPIPVQLSQPAFEPAPVPVQPRRPTQPAQPPVPIQPHQPAFEPAPVPVQPTQPTQPSPPPVPAHLPQPAFEPAPVPVQPRQPPQPAQPPIPIHFPRPSPPVPVQPRQPTQPARPPVPAQPRQPLVPVQPPQPAFEPAPAPTQPSPQPTQPTPVSISKPTHSPIAKSVNLASLSLSEQLALFNSPQPWKWECMKDVGIRLFESSIHPSNSIATGLIRALCKKDIRASKGILMASFVYQVKSCQKTLEMIRDSSITPQYKQLLVSQCQELMLTYYNLKFKSTEPALMVGFTSIEAFLDPTQLDILSSLMTQSRMAIAKHEPISWTPSLINNLLSLFLNKEELARLKGSYSHSGSRGLVEVIDTVLIGESKQGTSGQSPTVLFI